MKKKGKRTCQALQTVRSKGNIAKRESKTQKDYHQAHQTVSNK